MAPRVGRRGLPFESFLRPWGQEGRLSRGGSPEYVVVDIGAERVYWFVLRDGVYQNLPAGPDGLFRSEVFPGLWLDPGALMAEDLVALKALARGLATPEHAAFVAGLAALDTK